MSAIVGMLFADGRPVDPGDLERMTAPLAHRGPDGKGTWLGGRVGLGHLLLTTTPESQNERLPLERDGLTITADARLDNRDELLRALDISPAAPDGELILAAYGRWGEACPARLLGDFAFAVWDTRRRILFAARDHFGVKPLYYFCSPGVFAFASELKALLPVPFVPRRLDEERVADYLLSLGEDTESTFYRDIRRLPPAHTITATGETVTI